MTAAAPVSHSSDSFPEKGGLSLPPSERPEPARAPDLLLELLDRFVLQRALIVATIAEGVLGPEQEPVALLLYLGHRQPMLPGRGLRRCLALQKAHTTVLRRFTVAAAPSSLS